MLFAEHVLLRSVPLDGLGMRQNDLALRLVQRLTGQRLHLELANLCALNEGTDPRRTRRHTKNEATRREVGRFICLRPEYVRLMPVKRFRMRQDDLALRLVQRLTGQ